MNTNGSPWHSAYYRRLFNAKVTSLKHLLCTDPDLTWPDLFPTCEMSTTNALAIKITHKTCAAYLYYLFRPRDLSWPDLEFDLAIARSPTVTFANMLDTCEFFSRSFKWKGLRSSRSENLQFWPLTLPWPDLLHFWEILCLIYKFLDTIFRVQPRPFLGDHPFSTYRGGSPQQCVGYENAPQQGRVIAICYCISSRYL